MPSRRYTDELRREADANRARLYGQTQKTLPRTGVTLAPGEFVAEGPAGRMQRMYDPSQPEVYGRVQTDIQQRQPEPTQAEYDRRLDALRRGPFAPQPTLTPEQIQERQARVADIRGRTAARGTAERREYEARQAETARAAQEQTERTRQAQDIAAAREHELDVTRARYVEPQQVRGEAQRDVATRRYDSAENVARIRSAAAQYSTDAKFKADLAAVDQRDAESKRRNPDPNSPQARQIQLDQMELVVAKAQAEGNERLELEARRAANALRAGAMGLYGAEVQAAVREGVSDPAQMPANLPGENVRPEVEATFDAMKGTDPASLTTMEEISNWNMWADYMAKNHNIRFKKLSFPASEPKKG